MINEFSSNVLLINDLMPYIGVALSLYIWASNKINTKQLPVQLALVVTFLVWILLYLGDNDPTFNPSVYTVIGRVGFILAICLFSVQRYRTTQYITKLRTRISELESRVPNEPKD
jgi:hypothetical protein